MLYALAPFYRQRSTFMCNGSTLAAIRKLKDGQGAYLWQPSIAAGQPETLLSRPILESVDFPDISAEASERNRRSIEVGQRIQDEDVAICKSVQRGLSSRAYNAGRLSVRREAGEHLFHRLLHADLKSGYLKSLTEHSER